MSEPAPIPLATLRGATLRDGRVVDVAIDGDTVVAVVDAASSWRREGSVGVGNIC